MAHQLVKAKHIRLTTEIPDQAFIVSADEGRIRQMIMILIDNAIKFSDENGCVQVIIEQMADGCALEVRDNGRGIREEDLPHIFDRFYTTADSANPYGTGLGLSIAKEIAHRHHARISAVNRPEGGCIFRVVFSCTMLL